MQIHLLVEEQFVFELPSCGMASLLTPGEFIPITGIRHTPKCILQHPCPLKHSASSVHAYTLKHNCTRLGIKDISFGEIRCRCC